MNVSVLGTKLCNMNVVYWVHGWRFGIIYTNVNVLGA